MDDVILKVISVQGHTIRITPQQWAHITEAHDYMAGNLDKVTETLAEPLQVIQGRLGECLALRDYEHTNISRKTTVVIYRDEPDGFVITAYFTSKQEKTERKGVRIWPK
ncbi:MAG: hypothetical protein HYR94_05435 [Chloroflexi bacterium]|nr:hypothetical protein [Chloroflexota bacterium]